MNKIDIIYKLWCGFMKHIWGLPRINQANHYLIQIMIKELNHRRLSLNDDNLRKKESFYRKKQKEGCDAYNVKPEFLLLPSQIIAKAYIQSINNVVNIDSLEKRRDFFIKATANIEKENKRKINEKIGAAIIILLLLVLLWIM